MRPVMGPNVSVPNSELQMEAKGDGLPSASEDHSAHSRNLHGSEYEENDDESTSDVNDSEEYGDLDDSSEAPEIIKLKDKIAQQKNIITRLRRQLSEASANLAEVNNAVTYTMDDAHFSSEWRKLQNLISQWAAEYFQKRGPGNQTAYRFWNKSFQQPPELRNLGRHWKFYAESSHGRTLLAQAVVWKFLQTHLFAMPDRDPLPSETTEWHGAFWAAQYQPGLAHLNTISRLSLERLKRLRSQRDGQEIERALTDYVEWRVTNIICIQTMLQGLPIERRYAKELVLKIKKVLEPYANEVAFGKDLYRIIITATNLDSDMWKQKAYYHICQPNSSNHQGLLYDPNEMELYPTESLVQGGGTPNVTLVISPLLVKYGGSEGVGYNRSTIIANSVVSCQALEKAKMPFMRKRSSSRPPSRSASPPRPASSARVTKEGDKVTQTQNRSNTQLERRALSENNLVQRGNSNAASDASRTVESVKAEPQDQEGAEEPVQRPIRQDDQALVPHFAKLKEAESGQGALRAESDKPSSKDLQVRSGAQEEQIGHKSPPRRSRTTYRQEGTGRRPNEPYL